MWWTWWLGAAPATDVRPVVASPDVHRRFAAYLAQEGMPDATLACEPLWPGFTELCFRVWEAGRRRWVTASDLLAWRTTTAALAEAMTRAAPARLDEADRVAVDGMDAAYLVLTDGDGWAAAGVLRPDLLAAKLDALVIRVALPAESVLVAWPAGDPELDRVMAVGVRELYDSSPGPVSAHIHTWDGQRWRTFGEATPTQRAAGSAGASLSR